MAGTRAKKQQQAKLEKRKTYLTDSIKHIALAMQAEQCEYSEGVLRIWVLLEHYKRDAQLDADYYTLYPGFAGLYEIIKDMPTHEARKKLTKKEMAKMDMTRWQAEQQLESQITEDLTKIIEEFAS
ncbi:DUF2489 domain-containing protein [Psychrosphaera algicola]|uniref:DUF2489 domain-containing protein n=1 Tax=Psychrosphaera algicola TaxID=3023714 RepID=UPI002FEE5FAF